MTSLQHTPSAITIFPELEQREQSRAVLYALVDNVLTHYFPSYVEGLRSDDPEEQHLYNECILLRSRLFTEVNGAINQDMQDAKTIVRNHAEDMCQELMRALEQRSIRQQRRHSTALLLHS